MPLDWSPLWLSLRYAGAATALAALAALPLAWLMAHRRFPARGPLAAAASLPPMLPPAVLVYYLLAVLGRWPLGFSWHAALAVSTVYTLPVVWRGMYTALEAVDPRFENAGRILGAGEWRIFWRITLPLALRPLAAAVLTGLVRSFADFGVTAVVAAGVHARGWT